MTNANNNKQPVKRGIYRHYKNKEYRVLGCATHTETGEVLVVYEALYVDYKLWVRPLSMFLESVEVAGAVVPRFTFVRCEEKP